MEDELFQELCDSVVEAGKILRKEKKAASDSIHFIAKDIQNLRKRFKLSQSKFAQILGVKITTLQNWEQGRRKPNGPSRVLLQVFSKHPEAVLDSVQ